MIKKITSYCILINGTSEGGARNRVQIELRNRNIRLAQINFKDHDVQLEVDSEEDGVVNMYLPLSMLQSVLDILRNECPLCIYFVDGRAILSTFMEPVGEGEGDTTKL